jgi:hypothetical protein
MNTREMLTAFDTLLSELGLHFEAVVIGGAALNLLGTVSRETKDCDVLDPSIPSAILAAASEFQKREQAAGRELEESWLNNGPASLVPQLPEGWRDRLRVVFTGQAMTLHCLGRRELLMSKLFAYCDRLEDREDCIALAPTANELADILPWLECQDTNELWPEYVRDKLAELARGLGHGA